MFEANGLGDLKSEMSDNKYDKVERVKQLYVARIIEIESHMNNTEEKYKDSMKINSELADKI